MSHRQRGLAPRAREPPCVDGRYSATLLAMGRGAAYLQLSLVGASEADAAQRIVEVDEMMLQSRAHEEHDQRGNGVGENHVHVEHQPPRRLRPLADLRYLDDIE